MKRFLALILTVMMSLTLLTACGGGDKAPTKPAGGDDKVTEKAGDSKDTDTPKKDVELTMMVSQGWLEEKDDLLFEKFTEDTGIKIDVQVAPADQYPDLLMSRLNSGNVTDIYWIQTDPFAIKTTLIEPEKYCMDFTGEEWVKAMVPARLPSLEYDGKMYGMMRRPNSPEFTLLYNKTLFKELGIEEVPTTYAEFKDIAATVHAAGIIPWFLPGADGWQHQLPFFQIGGVYEEASPGLYEKLNNNEAKFQDNELMERVLTQMKEFADLGYFGPDWIATDSSNFVNVIGERQAAMMMAQASEIERIKEAVPNDDEFGFFLIPFGDNQTYPTNASGPAMFAYKDTKHPEEVKQLFNYLCEQENLQFILDNSTWTNLDVTLDLNQKWHESERELIDSIDPSKMQTSVLQIAVKYVNPQWMDVGKDMIAYISGQITAKDVLINMDERRAEMGSVQQDPNWK